MQFPGVIIMSEALNIPPHVPIKILTISSHRKFHNVVRTGSMDTRKWRHRNI